MCASAPSSSAHWFAIISQCFTILKKTTSGSVTILAHNISRSTCYRGCVFPKYLLSFLDNFSTLLVLKPWFLDFTGQSSKNPVFWGIKFAFFICALDTNLIHFPRKCKLWFIFSPSSAFNLSLSTGASHLLKCSISLIKTNKQKIMTPRKKNSKHP